MLCCAVAGKINHCIVTASYRCLSFLCPCITAAHREPPQAHCTSAASLIVSRGMDDGYHMGSVVIMQCCAVLMNCRTFPWNVTATDVCVFPSSMRRNFSDKHPARGAGIAYVTPITTGKCSLITGIVTDPAVITKPTGWKGLWAKLLPRSPLWLEHIKFHSVVDGDLAIQYGCDVNTVHSDGQTYFPATGVDKGMMAFRNWMKTYGNGGPPVSKMKQPTRPEAQLVIPREQLLDRYNQHTKHCKACSGALTNFQKVKTFSQQAAHLLAAGTLAVGVVAAVAAAQAVQAGGAAVQVASQAVQIGSQGSALLVPGWQMLLAVAVLGSASAGAAKLSKWAEGWVAKFVFVDYDHNHVSKMP
eukprot:GHRR01016595.1.p1 GENE.GHRR01016595.1~~GHRR01016595.1.p1  ORF type:complete len:358 (+),score=72.89 GHRR01016595.1:36-1109(+)